MADWEALLKKGDTLGQAKAISGLGESDLRKLVTPHIVERLAKDIVLRDTQIAMAFKKLGTNAKGAVPVLIEILKDKECKVRGYTAMCLMMIGDDAKDAVPALVELVGEGPRQPFLPRAVIHARDVGDQIAAAKAAVFIGVEGKQVSLLVGYIKSRIAEIGQRHDVTPIKDTDDIRGKPRKPKVEESNFADLADAEDEVKTAELRLWLALLAPKGSVGRDEWENVKSILEKFEKMKPEELKELMRMNPRLPESLTPLLHSKITIITIAEMRQLERKYLKQ